MAIGKLPLTGVVTVGATGVVGGSYLFLTRNNINGEKVKTLRDKYRLAILSSETDWNGKFDKLKGESTAPTYEPLKEAYSKKATDENVAKSLHREACEDVYKLPETTTDHLLEFSKYCFFNNLDKKESGKNLITEKSNFQDKWSTFSNKQETNLDSELIDSLRNKGSSGADSGWQDKMIAGCKKLSEKIYEGENEDFKGFCLK